MRRRLLVVALVLATAVSAVAFQYIDDVHNQSIGGSKTFTQQLTCNAGAVGCGAGGYTTVQEDGAAFPQRNTMNFTGAGVAVTDDGSGGGRTVVNIPGGGAGGCGYDQVQNGGAPVAQQTTLNCQGSSLQCIDDPGNSRTNLIVTAVNQVQDEGSNLAQQPTIDFAGAGVTATNDSGNSRTLVTIPGGTGYTTIDATGVAVTQRQTANFIAPLNPVDNPGSTRTDVSLGVLGSTQTFVAGGSIFTPKLVGDFGSIPGPVQNSGASETTVASTILRANAFDVNGRWIRIRAWGVLTGAVSHTIKIYFGTTPPTAPLFSFTGGVAGAWYMEATILRTGATSALAGGFAMDDVNTKAQAAGLGNIYNFAIDNPLSMTTQGSGSGDSTLYGASVEFAN